MQQQACIFLSLNFAAHISIEIFLDAPQESCQVQLQVGFSFSSWASLSVAIFIQRD